MYFGTYNRGKKSLCLDMRKDEGKRVFMDLLAKADMVLENFRPGVMEEMGLSYEELCKVKPAPANRPIVVTNANPPARACVG